MGASGEIYFRCPACRGRLGAERAAVGRLVSCPACHASMLVPERSTVWPPAVRRACWIVATQGAVASLLAALAVWLVRTPGAASQRADAPPAAVVEQGTPSQRYLGPRREAEAPSEPAAERAYSELQASHRVLSRRYEDLANWILDNMRGRLLLKEKFAARLQFTPLTDAYQLHPDLAEFLAVSPDEQAMVDDAFGFGLATLATLESQFLSVTQSAPGRVALYIPPYEKEGGLLRDDLYGALQSVLGEERFGRLVQSGGAELEKLYHYFGRASRTLVFHETAGAKAEDPPYLVIRDGWIIPDGPGKRNIQVSEISATELPRAYLPYAAWLPDFLAPYVKP